MARAFILCYCNENEIWVSDENDFLGYSYENEISFSTCVTKNFILFKQNLIYNFFFIILGVKYGSDMSFTCFLGVTRDLSHCSLYVF